MPLDTPLAGLKILHGISLPGSLDGMVVFSPSGSTTGFGRGVFPSHLNFLYSAAPTCAYWSVLNREGLGESSNLIPPRSVFPNLDQPLIELRCFFIRLRAVKLCSVDIDI